MTSFPRARGDAPGTDVPIPANPQFPPRTRGCTQPRSPRQRRPEVSPAHAGMHPLFAGILQLRFCFPRARGDAPDGTVRRVKVNGFPPRTRGCTLRAGHQTQRGSVSPAHAGMHPLGSGIRRRCTRFPRARGDAPRSDEPRYRSMRFPPRTRGCTRAGEVVVLRRHVSPAHAGMHPAPEDECADCEGFPRARGDAPSSIARRGSRSGFPPRTRGCTLTGLVDVPEG